MFTTRCDPFTVPFTEPFDGLDTLPACWFTLTNDQLAKVALSDSLAWSDSLAAGLYGGQDTTKFVALIAPEVSDLVSQDNRIRFMARTYTDTATLVVGTMSDPFDTLAFTGYDTLQILPTYQEYTVMFDTNYKLTDEYITFKHGMSGKSQSIFLDDISYEVIPCVLPDSLYADSVAPTAAKLFWTEHNFAKNWEMMIDTAGFDTTGVTPETVYENPYVRTGLRPNTSYEWYIKTCCNVGDTVSQWTGPSTFTTRSLTRKAPYLLYDGVDTAMQLNWQLNDSASCTIDWGVDLNYDSTAQTIEYGDDHQHQYTFAGLSEDTKYYYQVTIGNEIYTGDFKTAPPETSTKFSFFAYGDTRTNPAAHDSVAEKILENIQNDTAAQTFILASGDLVANGDNEADWDDQFFDPQYANIQEMLRTLPYMACMGNHERQGTGFGKYFPYVFYNSPRFYGSFDYANAHFIIIDQYTDYSSGSDQYIWLENDLAGTNKPWKIIVLHEPGWTAGGHANNTDVQDYIQPLCETYNVQFVFGGHNHYYARAEVNGVIHITTGGGGAPLYPVNPFADSIKVANMSYHFCKVSIDNNLCTFTAIDRDGNTIDSLTKRIYICPDPDSLYTNSITQTAAKLNWTENGTATQWQLRADVAGFDTTGVTPVTITENPYQLTGLISNTSYDWYIRAYCGAGDSSRWVDPETFTTLCDPVTASVTENFDGLTVPEIPGCWSLINTDTLENVITIDSLAASGTIAAALFGRKDTTDFIALITPGFSDLPSQKNQVRFMARTYTGNSSLIVGTMADPADTLTFKGFDTVAVNTQYSEFTILFDTNYKDTAQYIVFKHGMSDTSFVIIIDDFNYEEIPYLYVDPSDTLVPVLSDSVNLTLSSNTTWSVSENADWFEVLPAGGAGDDSLAVVYNTNDSGHERTDTILVTSIYGDVDTVYVTQESPHFQPVWTGNPLDSMNFVVDSAFLNELYLQAGDEIAVFDYDSTIPGEVCVGVVVLTGEFTPDVNYTISAATDDPDISGLQGFINGDSIRYRYWDASESAEVFVYHARYNPANDSSFISLGTAVVGLDGHLSMWLGTVDDHWDNPSNWRLGQVPASTDKVFITTGYTFAPAIYSDVSIQRLYLEKGSVVTIKNNATLTITGNQ